MNKESIGHRIINNIPLSVEQADEVFADLEKLHTTGIWNRPFWATELADLMHITLAISAVQLAGWKAIAKAYKEQPTDNKMFAIYHQHEYGSTQWVLLSKIYPTQEQVVEALGIIFEPEKDEYIDIEEISKIHTLELS